MPEMTMDEFFSEAKRLKCRVLPQGEDLRTCLDAKDEEIERLRGVIKRLGSVEAFTSSRSLKAGQDSELLARINFAQSAAAAWAGVQAPAGEGNSDRPDSCWSSQNG